MSYVLALHNAFDRALPESATCFHELYHVAETLVKMAQCDAARMTT
jgi:hypothetical protein